MSELDENPSQSVFIIEDQGEQLLKSENRGGIDRKYHICCCHVWVCTLLIGVAELIMLTVNLIFTSAAYGTVKMDRTKSMTDDRSSLITGICGATLGFLVVGLLIHGVLKQKYPFLIPHLLAQILAILVSVILCILFVTASLTARKKQSINDWTLIEIMFDRSISTKQCINASVVSIFLILLQSAFFVAVLRCYIYLKEISRRFDEATYMPMMAVKGAPNA